MTAINKLLTSVIFYSLISYLLMLPDYNLGLLFALLGTQIPVLLPKNYKSSLIMSIPLLSFILIRPDIFIALSVGYYSSIFIDLLSKEGCRLLYPYSDITFTGGRNYLENDTKKDYAATTFLLVLVIITLVLSNYGEEVLNQLNENGNVVDYINNRIGNYIENRDNGYVQYINIDPADCNNKNITTTTYNNTTTTLISDYEK